MEQYYGISPELEARLRNELAGEQGLPNPRYAVVIPLVCGGEEPELLIEVRAKGISQSGDPCFPGGHIERGETPMAAALRELEEELGICAVPMQVLGQLPTVETWLGSMTDVFAAVIPVELADRLSSNPDEVSEVLRVPLSYFLERPLAGSYPFGGHTIWGMTAGAIHHFCSVWRRCTAD